MRYLRLMMAALAAIFAIGALMAASAVALPTILPETVTAFTGKNIGETQWKIVGSSEFETIKCREALFEGGTIEQPKPLGLFHITLKQCKSGGFLNVACTGLGEATETVLSLGSWHIVYDTLKAALSEAGVAILFLPGNTHFECAGKLFIFKLGGMILCLILNPTALTKRFEFHCNENISTHKPEDTKYYNASGTLTNIVPLETSENEGAGKETIQVWLGTIEYSAAVLLMI